MAQLAEAVEALAVADSTAEPTGHVGDAVLTLAQLRDRLDAAVLGLLGSFDARGDYRDDGRSRPARGWG